MFKLHKELLTFCRAGYDAKANAITGFSLPRQANGYPLYSSAIVKTATDIFNKFHILKKANLKIVTMVQSLCDGSTPLRLCSFASDSRYFAEDVEASLTTAVKEMEELGIFTLVTSADGDSREMKVMRQRLRLGVPLTKQGNIYYKYHETLKYHKYVIFSFEQRSLKKD